METVKDIASTFANKLNENRAKRRQIDAKIQMRRAQIERLEKRMAKLESYNWVDDVMRPLAARVQAAMPGYRIEVLGPFGLRAEVSLHAYPGDSDDIEAATSVSFEPAFEHDSETQDCTFGLKLIDYSRDLGYYEKNTVGSLNGLNHPSTPLDPQSTVEDIVAMLREGERI